MTDHHSPSGGGPGTVEGGAGTPLRDLLGALGAPIVELIEAPSGQDVRISTVALVDESDVASEAASRSPLPDLSLHVGVAPAQQIRWLARVTDRDRADRPVALMAKPAAGSEALLSAARRAGVALVAVHSGARWDQVLLLVQRTLERARRATPVDRDGPDDDIDLFDLAQIVADNIPGLVSFEDPQSRLLAYSATDETADDMRIQSILGRAGPANYLQVLRGSGVFERLGRTDDVVDVPAHPQSATRRRLVVNIREPGPAALLPGRLLGTMWVQQGRRPFAPDAAEMLRGAAAVAGRILARGLNAPTTEGLMIQRLFGARGGGVDVPSLAGALRLPVEGPAAVIGFATGTAKGAAGSRLAALAAVLRLHAGAFRPDALTTTIGERIYLLLPGYRSADTVAAWTRQLVDQIEKRHAAVLRAVIVAPVPDLGHVADARVETDRVLDATTGVGRDGRVTTLAESRTAVLLTEILDLVGRRPELRDPRLGALVGHDRRHTAHLTRSLATYLDRHGDVRAAAAALNVHPNTLRHRIRRAEDILGVDLTDAADRLLLQLQLAMPPRGDDAG